MRAHPLNLPPRLRARVALASAWVLAGSCVLIGPLGMSPARAASQHRAKTHSPLASRNLWATVDVCSSTRHLDTIGIRGSMPGTGRSGELMFMRFRAQFLSSADHLWHYAHPHFDTGYKGVGSTRFVARQSGWSFSFPPAAHARYTLRGVVNFQWRQKARIVLRAHLVTSAGHTSAVDARPPGYSASTCSLR
jgi:hypothetical protein